MSATNPLLDAGAMELVDFSGGGGRDIESQLPSQRKPRASCCGTIVRDYMELAPCSLAVGAIALGIIFGLSALGAYYVDNADYRKWGFVAVGAIGVAFSITVCLVGFCSCLTIRHLRPEKDLEGQISQLGKTVRDYGEQIKGLQQINAHLKKLSEDFKAIAQHQIQLKEQTEKMLQDKVAEMSIVNQHLQETQRALENSEHVLAEFQKQIAEANVINDQISKTLMEAGKHLPEMGFVHDGGHDHGATVVDVGALSNAHLAFNDNNTDLTQLTAELKKQLVVMQGLQDSLTKHEEIFRAGAMSLDETDDKLLEAAKALGATTEKRFLLMRQLSEKMRKTGDVFTMLKRAIEQITDPTLKDNFNPIVVMIDSLD